MKHKSLSRFAAIAPSLPHSKFPKFPPFKFPFQFLLFLNPFAFSFPLPNFSKISHPLISPKKERKKKVVFEEFRSLSLSSNGFFQETSSRIGERIRSEEMGHRRNRDSGAAEAGVDEGGEGLQRRRRRGGVHDADGARVENTGEDGLPGGAAEAPPRADVSSSERILQPSRFGIGVHPPRRES